MDDNTPVNEQLEDSPEARARKDKLQELIAKGDAITPNPTARALKVWDALNKEGITTWDLICFCSETLGFLVPAFPDLMPGTRRVLLDVYYTHYQNPQALNETQIPDEIPASPLG